ncbi:hypothetical protein STENM327S_04137 [Streptomyces tendae]
MSSMRVSRASWRSVTARCLRTSTADAVGRLEKSLGQTSSTRWRTRGAGSSRAATRSRASTYTAACRAAAPTFAGSAEPSSMGKDLISTTVQLPSGCTTTASGSRKAGEPATSRASIGWSSSVHTPGAPVASRRASAVRAVRPSGPVADRSGTWARASAGGSAARSSFSCTRRSSSAPPSALTFASKALPRVRANCDCPKADGEPSAPASKALSTPAPSRIARRRHPGLAARAARARASSALAGTSGPRSSASRCRICRPASEGAGSGSAPGPNRCSRCRGNRSPAEVWHPPLTIAEPAPSRTESGADAGALEEPAAAGAKRAVSRVRARSAVRSTNGVSSSPAPITAAPATASRK